MAYTTWQARDALGLNEERSAQQRREEKKKEERKAAERLKHAHNRVGMPYPGDNGPDPRDNNLTDEERARTASLLHHLPPALNVSGRPVKPQDPHGENAQHPRGKDSEKRENHHQRTGGHRGEGAGGAGVAEQVGGEGGQGTRGGDSRGRESNDVAFVLRKLYTGGGLDAQQQSWKCMPTNLFNTLTLQLGTLSKVCVRSKVKYVPVRFSWLFRKRQ